MLKQTLEIKPLLLGFGLALSATFLAACAGTGSDTGSTAVQHAGDETQAESSESQAAVQASPQNGNMDADKGIDAVIKFAKEVEIDGTVKNEETARPSAGTEAEKELPQQYVFHFETNSVSLKNDALQEIEKHAHYLRAHANSVVSISGHADIRGSSEYNQALSLKRAHAVAEKLRQLGVAEEQIMVASHGEGAPAVDEGNWGENRRVELEYLDDYMLSTR